MLAGEPILRPYIHPLFQTVHWPSPHFPSDTPAPTHLQHQSFPLPFFLLLGSSPGPLPLPLGPPNQELGEHQGHEEPGPVHLAGLGGHSLVGGWGFLGRPVSRERSQGGSQCPICLP